MKKPFLYIFLISILSVFIAQANKNVPLRFIENKGQWVKNVKFQLNIPDGRLFVEKDRLTFSLYDPSYFKDHHGHSNDSNVNEYIKFHAYSIVFKNASPLCRTMGEQKNPELNNFYLGNNPSKWASGAFSYKNIHYVNLWDGIDMILKADEKGLKYDFIVKPNADISQIQMEYIGQNNITLNSNGGLTISTSIHTIEEEKPFVYQRSTNGNEVCPFRFELKNNIVSFKALKNYNKSKELIIDPQLIFSTYSGSFADNWGNTATNDTLGNMYSGGTVFSVGYPTTLGSFQVNYNGIENYGYGIDVGILKFNPNGTGLLYCTYIGGFLTDVPSSLVVNKDNELIIFGITSSYDFPLSTNAYDPVFKGGLGIQPVSGIIFYYGSDLFLTHLNENGTALIGSTYIGGSNNDGILYFGKRLTKNYGDQLRGDVYTDSDNNIYIASSTRSSDFPVTAGSYDNSLNTSGTEAMDGVVAKFNNDLSQLVWSTYLGGIEEDMVFSIQTDSMQKVYVAGGTSSNDFPVTPGTYKQTIDGNVDGFIAVFDSLGTSILASTYIGTSTYDQCYFIQIDDSANVYVLGQTNGAYPVSSGVYTNAGGGQFIHSLDKTLTTSRFSTVIGSGGFTPNISLTAFLVNDCGNIFLSGWGGENNDVSNGYIGGTTDNLPITSDAFKSNTDGSDFYIMVLEKDAKSLLYATYFGGNGSAEHVDGGTSRFDKKGVIYQSVCAGCGGNSLFPTTPGVWSPTNKSYWWDENSQQYFSNCNNAAFKFDLSSLKAGLSENSINSCGEKTVTFNSTTIGGKTFQWKFGDGTTANTEGPHVKTYLPGTYQVVLKVTDFTTCTKSDSALTTVVVPPKPEYNLSGNDTSVCYGGSVQIGITYYNNFQYTWTPSNTLNNPNIHNPIATPASTTDYKVDVLDLINNCTFKDTIRVEVVFMKDTIYWTNITKCDEIPTVVFSNPTKGKVSWLWEFGDGTFSNEQSPTHTYPSFGNYNVKLNINSNGCSREDTALVIIEKVFIPNLFTPNNDNQNDVWKIKGITKDWKVNIYNRWGSRIYANDNYDNNWNANDVSDDVYYFLIEHDDNKKCKGWIQVIR